jgi:hypothetical protein
MIISRSMKNDKEKRGRKKAVDKMSAQVLNLTSEAPISIGIRDS